MLRLRRLSPSVLGTRRIAAALLVVVALALALRPPPTPAAAMGVDGVPLVIAAQDLAPGTVLTRTDLTVVEAPAGIVPAGTARDPTALVGRVLAVGARSREPLTDTRLVGAGLVALLSADQVAAPVRLADLGVAALVRTGDRVDVLAAAAGGAPAEVVAADALVLAASAGVEDPASGLLLVAVDRATAARLAGAAATATLTVTLVPP